MQTVRTCARILVRLGVVICLALALDGCVNRDPHIRLPGGYALVAISPGSPSELTYEPGRDPRGYPATRLHSGKVGPVKSFDVRDPFVFGQCENGYLVLNVNSHECRILGQDAWTREVIARTGSPPRRMKSPRSRLLQTRDGLGYAIPGGFMVIALPWAVAPGWGLRRARKEKGESRIPSFTL